MADKPITDLAALWVLIKGRARALFKWPILMLGLDSDGNFVPVGLNPDGTPATPTGTARTPAIILDTDGSHSPIAAGKKSVAFIFSSDWTGTVLGQAVDATKVSQLGFDAPPWDTLTAIAFTTSAGTLTITTLT